MNTPTAHELRQELNPRRLLAGLTTGMISSILEVPLEISFAALVFTGLLSPYLSYGIGYLLMGAIILSAMSTFLNSYPGSVSLPQDTSAVIVATMAASITVALSDAPQEILFLTVLAAITCASVITGISFLIIARFRLGRLVRYLPYPVTGGFLAGTGLLLLLGGLGIALGQPVSLGTINVLIQPQNLARWLPVILFAYIMFFAVKRFSGPLVLPGILAGILVLFFGFIRVVGISIQEATELGLLLGPFPAGSLWQLPPLVDLAQVDWSIILQQSGQIVSLVVISTISLLLNTGGFELVLRQDIDVNQELRSAGVANIAAGFVGSLPGYLAISLSTLSSRTGAKSRSVGLFIAITLLLVMIFGAPLIALFPRMAAGSLVCFLGVTFLAEWVVQSWFNLSRSDYLVLLVIMTTMVVISPLAGVGIGLVLAALFFIIEYSRVNVIRHVLDGKSYHSIVERPPIDRMILRQQSDWIYILELQGFIFFGTTQNFWIIFINAFMIQTVSHRISSY